MVVFSQILGIRGVCVCFPDGDEGGLQEAGGDGMGRGSDVEIRPFIVVLCEETWLSVYKTEDKGTLVCVCVRSA